MVDGFPTSSTWVYRLEIGSERTLFKVLEPKLVSLKSVNPLSHYTLVENLLSHGTQACGYTGN